MLNNNYNVSKTENTSICNQQFSFLFLQIVRRPHISDDFEIPNGWTRKSISDKSDPLFEFYISTVFEDQKNFLDYDQGLLTFITVNFMRL